MSSKHPRDDKDDKDGKSDKKKTNIEIAAEVVKQTECVSSDHLRLYYRRLFPFKQLWQWLGHTPKKKREFSMTIDDDVYLRYQYYSSAEEFHSELIARTPIKLDVGPCYNTSLDPKETVGMMAVQSRELVFDVDLDSYDDVRICGCEKAQVCNSCWLLAVGAMQVIHDKITEDLGYKHVLWVYSGRRGVHGWVCDDGARLLSAEKRDAVVGYLSYDKKAKERSNHVLKRSYDISLPWFEQAFIPKLLEGKANQDQFWAATGVTDEKLKRKLIWGDACKTGTDRWKAFCANAPKVKDGQDALFAVVMHHMHPRLDTAVTRQMNHLLKCPFMVHPKTGRVCVPIDPYECKFRPDQAPLLWDLVRDKTSLKPFVDYFSKEFMALFAKPIVEPPFSNPFEW